MSARVVNNDVNTLIILTKESCVDNFKLRYSFNIFIYSNVNKRSTRILIANTSAKLQSSFLAESVKLSFLFFYLHLLQTGKKVTLKRYATRIY